MATIKIGMTIEEAAECSGIGRNTMRKLVEWRKLPVLKVGRKTIIRSDTLERFMTVNQERKDIAGQIQRTEQEIGHRLDALPSIVQAEGYPDVQAFTATYRKAEAVVSRYNRELAEWERKVQERRQPVKMGPPPETRSVRERLRRLQDEGRRKQPQPRKRAADRDSR